MERLKSGQLMIKRKYYCIQAKVLVFSPSYLNLEEITPKSLDKCPTCLADPWPGAFQMFRTQISTAC